MKMFYDYPSFINELVELLNYKKIDKIFISTFNVFTYQSHTKLLLDTIAQKKIPTTIYCGITKYRPCNPDCKDCKNKYEKYILTYKELEKKYPNVKWIFNESLHLKLYVFYSRKRTYIYTGGMNLTDSSFIDISMSVDMDKKIINKCISNIAAGTSVDIKTIKTDIVYDRFFRMTFGMYEGKTLEEVDKAKPNYLTWMVDKGLLPKDVLNYKTNK